jgi:hypothetical protein
MYFRSNRQEISSKVITPDNNNNPLTSSVKMIKNDDDEKFVEVKKDGVLVARVYKPSHAFTLGGVCHDVRDLVYLFMKGSSKETTYNHKFHFILDGTRAERTSCYSWEWSN